MKHANSDTVTVTSLNAGRMLVCTCIFSLKIQNLLFKYDSLSMETKEKNH